LSTAILPCLSLDLHADKWAFVAAAMVETDNLRPKGFPKFLGKDFFLIGYRVLLRYRGENGRFLRGPYALGFLHFHSRIKWLATFELVGPLAELEEKHTPFLSVFTLRS